MKPSTSGLTFAHALLFSAFSALIGVHAAGPECPPRVHLQLLRHLPSPGLRASNRVFFPRLRGERRNE